ncbi:capsular polysaccharide biosynthesis protein [Bifidobacterium eulemuris]|nr:capsular polysaccharide biosynthesis protein [Bifidobacterium eulemuris]
MLADSDDYLAPCALQDSLNLLTDSQTDIAYCGYWTDRDGDIRQKRFRFFKGRYSHNQAVTEHLNLHTLYGYPWGKLFRREVLEDVWNPEDMSYGEDGVFSYRALYNAERGVAFTDKPIYYYRIRRDSLTQHGQGFRERDLEILKQVQYVREWTKDESFAHPLNVFEFISYTGMMQKYLAADATVRNEFTEEFMTMKTACDSTWKSCLLHAKNPAFRLRALRYGLRRLESLR